VKQLKQKYNNINNLGIYSLVRFWISLVCIMKKRLINEEQPF